MRILEGLKPKKVFYYFEEISAIPRGSGKTDEVRNYCADFAKARGLEYVTDDAGNIIIFKPACGKEGEPVIIQGHLDMVWEKDETCRIDFEKDGLELFIENGYIGAKGTTLGADDGIAVAMCLALLDSDDIVHPPLEIVFTADEEVGMTGATGLDCSVLKGKRMINLDSEEDGVMWVSCAGGVRADVSLDIEFAENKFDCFEISVSGLHGGHSGAEIHNGYANANKVLGRVLSALAEKADFALCHINGGSMDNAITRDSKCTVASDSDICRIVSGIYDVISADYRKADPDIKISASPCGKAEKSMSAESSENVIALLNDLPSGVVAMSKDIENFVETSLNLGVLKTVGDAVSYSFAVRSGVDAEREKLCERLKEIAGKYGAKIGFRTPYPAWEFKEGSELQELMKKIYSDINGRELVVTGIHAGLECGMFCGKIKGLDCVSLGPEMHGIHTPQERLSIESCEKLWNFLLAVLKTI
ncbi:MAG: aminoacyl-histidine dipeptidase [Clostridia bacterium]|nr:aminoacyl-histidine dipeptidase [Clostridia bacterium]